MQQNSDGTRFEQSKSVEKPLQGGGGFCAFQKQPLNEDFMISSPGVHYSKTEI